MATDIINLNSIQKYLENVDCAAYKLVSIWYKNKENTSDEFFTQHLECKITVVRSILNKLHYYGIVNYDKIKNENSGWFTFKWHLDYNKLSKLVFLNNLDKLEKLNAKEKYYGEYQMFVCKNSCNDFPFEVAAEYNFNCPMCNETLKHIDYVEKHKELQAQIKIIEEENVILSLFLKENNKK